MKAKRFTLLVLSLVVAMSVLVSGCSPAPASSATSEATPAPPKEVVESFYRWHLDYSGNTMADGAYRSSEYLTEAFIQRVDDLLASFDKGGYDPFLCAQDIPAELTVDEPTVSGQEATVVVHEIWNPGTKYELVHDVTVTLRFVDSEWKIDDIACGLSQHAALAPEMAPEQVVEGFYDWYLGYIGDPVSGQMRNPLVDGAYRSSEYLTEAFIQQVEDLLASFDKGGYDPFLCAQDIPRSFSVDAPAVSGQEAVVILRELWNPGTQYERAQDVRVALRMVDGVWKIDGIACIDASVEVSSEQMADWQVFADQEYGFQFRYPADWAYEDVPPVPAGMEVPDGLKALRRVLLFAPRGWDGVAPPLHIQVTEGTEEEFGRLFVPATSSEQVEVNGYPVIKEIEGLGEVQVVRYVFQSPTDEAVHIVALDYISGFPDRAAGHEDVIDTLQQILSTFEWPVKPSA